MVLDQALVDAETGATEDTRRLVSVACLGSAECYVGRLAGLLGHHDQPDRARDALLQATHRAQRSRGPRWPPTPAGCSTPSAPDQGERQRGFADRTCAYTASSHPRWATARTRGSDAVLRSNSAGV